MVSIKPRDKKEAIADKSYCQKKIKPEADPVELDFHYETKLKTLKKTYPQNWPAYNNAQTHEFEMLQDILIELIDLAIAPHDTCKRGRPYADLRDMIFCCVMRSYYVKACRRSVSFLKDAVGKGYISKVPCFNTILNYYRTEAMTPILKHLIQESARPLSQFEQDFMSDSSGFSTSMYGRWLNDRTQSEVTRRMYKKAHVFSGRISNIIAAVEVTPGYSADSPQFSKLIGITARNFQIREVSADKAYSSRRNLAIAASLGAIPFIPFREGSTSKPRGCQIWSTMKKFYDENRDYFMLHYHKRSNAETVFSMMKKKYDHKLKSRSDVGQINEILCKALVHNICVLIEEYYEETIKLRFDYCAKMGVVR